MRWRSRRRRLARKTGQNCCDFFAQPLWGVKSRIGGPQAPWSGRFKGRFGGGNRNPPPRFLLDRARPVFFSKKMGGAFLREPRAVNSPPGGGNGAVLPQQSYGLLHLFCTKKRTKRGGFRLHYKSGEKIYKQIRGWYSMLANGEADPLRPNPRLV